MRRSSPAAAKRIDERRRVRLVRHEIDAKSRGGAAPAPWRGRWPPRARLLGARGIELDDGRDGIAARKHDPVEIIDPREGRLQRISRRRRHAHCRPQEDVHSQTAQLRAQRASRDSARVTTTGAPVTGCAHGAATELAMSRTCGDQPPRALVEQLLGQLAPRAGPHPLRIARAEPDARMQRRAIKRAHRHAKVQNLASEGRQCAPRAPGSHASMRASRARSAVVTSRARAVIKRRHPRLGCARHPRARTPRWRPARPRAETPPRADGR